MCDDHSGVLVEIPSASISGEHGRKRGIDACIAPLVEALNAVGLDTRASCCGHGKRPGNIILNDGREVLIARNFDEGRLVDKVLDSTYGSVHENGAHDQVALRAVREWAFNEVQDVRKFNEGYLSAQRYVQDLLQNRGAA